MADQLTDEQDGWVSRCEQHVWDCRSAKLTAVRTPLRLGNPTLTMLWACVRDPQRPRPVQDEECARCHHWERDGLPR
jgi:hypothetical protein